MEEKCKLLNISQISFKLCCFSNHISWQCLVLTCKAGEECNLSLFMVLFFSPLIFSFFYA